MIISEIVTSYHARRNLLGTMEWEERHRAEPARLFVSDILGCDRKAVLAAHKHLPYGPLYQPVTHPHDDRTLNAFEMGNEFEDITWRALHEQFYGGIARNVPISWGIWSGRIDFLVAQCGEFPNGAIIEHKATHPYSFKEGRMPYDTHAYQVLAYQKMFDVLYGMMVPAYLYYRSWGVMAEFEVESIETGFGYKGHINGKPVDGEVDVDRGSLHEVLDDGVLTFFNAIESGTLPEVPYKKDNEHPYDCTYKGRVRCQWYGHCWNQED